LALTGDNKAARLWETASGKLVGEPLRQESWVSGVMFSPDGNTFAMQVSGAWRLWELAARKRIPLEFQEKVGTSTITVPSGRIAFSPDGKTLIATGFKTARLFEAATGMPRGEPFHHDDDVHGLAFSRDGKLVVTTSYDRTARVWEARTGRPMNKPLLHDARVLEGMFSADGKIVATVDEEDMGHFWDVSTSRPLGPPFAALEWCRLQRSAFLSHEDQRKLRMISARLWLDHLRPPLSKDPERIEHGVQVVTGMTLDEDGVSHVLDGQSWQSLLKSYDP
jgi:WD40 repeat protein